MRRWLGLVPVLALSALAPLEAQAADRSFPAGSLIIPMDQTYQSTGMQQAWAPFQSPPPEFRSLGDRSREDLAQRALQYRRRPVPEAPARISAISAELQQQGIWRKLWRLEAEEADERQLALVHPSKYLNYLEARQPQNGKIARIDDDTVMSSHSLSAARCGAGAVIKAVDRVMQGKVSNAFCAVRPPGRHAESDRAGGFCLINNVAVGAMHAIAQYRVQRVAVIDFDVRHANGTEEIFKGDPRVLLLNSCEPDLYPFPKPEIAAGATIL